MTATAITAVAPTLPGAAAPGAANAAAQTAGPLAGFEALLGALFPQAAPTGASAAATTLAAADATADPLAGGEDDDAPAEAEVTLGVVADPNTALAASLAATPAAAIVAAPATAPLEPVKGGRAQGVTRPTFVLNTRLDVPATGKDELAPEAADAETDVANAGPKLLDIPHGKAEAKPAPPAWGVDKPAGQPAAPALANASPKAELAERPDAVATEAPAPEAAPAAGASDSAVLAAAVAGRPEPARTAAPAPKPAKSERVKATSETAPAGDLKAPDAADKPATARAVTAAAKPAAAEAEVADAGTGAAKSSLDQPDTAAGGETRAATQTAAPLAHAAHAVRGAPETVANLAAQIVKKLEAKTTHFDVELNPGGLGKVNVRIDIGAQGAITAAMSFDNPQAAAELRSRAAELQRHLEQAGFNLSGGVTFDVAQDRGQHGQAWQQAQQDDNNSGRAFRGQAFQSALDTAGDAADAALSGALRLRRGVTAGLDVRI